MSTKDVFLPNAGAAAARQRHGLPPLPSNAPVRGAVWRADDQGTQSILPAVRWPDGRIEIHEGPSLAEIVDAQAARDAEPRRCPHCGGVLDDDD